MVTEGGLALGLRPGGRGWPRALPWQRPSVVGLATLQGISATGQGRSHRHSASIAAVPSVWSKGLYG